MNLTANLPAVVKGRTQVLHPIQIAAQAGQVLGVIGPNGAGKSTLLRNLAGLETPYACWNGQLLSRDHIGYLPQTFHMNAQLSVLEAVLLGKREALGWRVPQADLTAAGAVLAELGLSHLAARSMDSLSGGQQQMVLLAQRVLRAPRLMVLDEPTSALDLHHQLGVLRHLKAYARREGAVVVMALHDLTLAARFCDRLLLLCKGQGMASGDCEAVLSSQMIAASWQISPEILRAKDGACVIVPH